MSKLSQKKLERRLDKFINNGDNEKALKTVNKLSKMYPDDKDYILTKAKLYETLGDFESSATEFKKILDLDDVKIVDYLFVNENLNNLWMDEDALEVLEKGLEAFPDEDELIIAKVNQLINFERDDEAYAYIDEFDNDNPLKRELLLLKSHNEYELDNDENALKICNELLEQKLDEEALSAKFEILRYNSLKYDRLTDELEEFLNDLTNNEEFKGWAVAKKAELLEQKDEAEKGLNILNEFLNENPDDLHAIFKKGEILMALGKFDEAEKLMRDSSVNNKKLWKVPIPEVQDESVREKLSDDDIEEIITLTIAMKFREYGNIDGAVRLLESIPEDSPFHEFAVYMTLNLRENIENMLKRNMGNFSPDDADILDEILAKRKNDPRSPFEMPNMADEELSEAEELINKAWDSDDIEERRKLAEEALELDKYAIDAYNVLAHTVEDMEEKKNYFKQAIDLFQQEKGDKYFEENGGHFWGLVETRPFMRALDAYSQILEGQGHEEDAIDWYDYMLYLNPDDNQGARYSLMNLLISSDRLDDAEKIINYYDDEYSAYFNFSKLLWAIKKNLSDKSIKKYFDDAVESNKHVIPILIGDEPFPDSIPTYYTPEEPSEALHYLLDGFMVWHNDENAIKTLEYLYAKDRRRNPRRR